MKLNHSSRYAIHAVVYLAAKYPDGLLASHQVARACGIPEKFLLKVLKALAQSGVLYSRKGPGGGFCLAVKPNQITLLDIVEAVDGPVRGQTIFGDAMEKSALGKKLESAYDHAAELVRREYRKVRISDLVRKK